MRLDAAIADATERLSRVSESPRLDAEILLCRTIDMPRSYLFAHPEDELDAITLERFEEILRRREDGAPMAYIMGVKEFWSHEFAVSPATLVPRPETEILVNLAQENARALSQGNVECLLGDWTAPVRERTFDLIVSNPPYVRADDEALAALRHEPRSALVSGEDGLDAIRTLASDCRDILVAHGLLLIEHGSDQREEVAAILKAQGWADIECHNDLAGLPRVTAARRGGT
jgi:release factor glutamine methyltransferase